MPVDKDEVRRILEEREKRRKDSGSGEPLSSLIYNLPKEGQAKIRHLPPWEGFPLPGVIIWTHWNIPEIGRAHCLKSWEFYGVSPKDEFNHECAICMLLKVYRGLIKLDDFIARGTGYTNSLILEDLKQPSWVDPFTPKIQRHTGNNQGEPYSFFWLLEQINNKEVGDITDPVTGSNVTYKRKKAGGPFERIVSRISTPIADTPDKIQEILGKMKKLDQIWKYPTDEEFQKIRRGAELLAGVLENRLAAEKHGDTRKEQSKEQAAAPAPAKTEAEKPKVAPAANPSPAPAAAPVPVKQAEPEKAKPTLPPPATSTVKRPPKAPACYGLEFIGDETPGITLEMKSSPQYRKCQACPLDFLCKQVCKQAFEKVSKQESGPDTPPDSPSIYLSSMDEDIPF